MPVISARIDDATFEKFKEYLKNNGISSHSEFIKKTVDDAVTNDDLKLKDYVRLAKECLDRIEVLSSAGDEIEQKLIFEMGKEVILGLHKDNEGRAVVKNGLVTVSNTVRRNELLKSYLRMKNIQLLEAESSKEK